MGFCKFFVFNLIAIILAGCSSALIVTSEPSGASVFVKTSNGTDRVELGKTPLEMRTSELELKAKIDNNSGEYRELFVESEGFEAQKLFLPPARFTTLETKIFAKLEPSPPPKPELAEQMVQHLFNAQSFAQKADYEKAQLEIDSAIKISPKFARAYSMRGTIYYLQSNFLESLKWYEKALEVDPKNQDSMKMITVLREKIKAKGETK